MTDELSDDDLQQRFEALDKAQEIYEEVAYLSNPKMPCPECSGSGSIYSGSLGDLCVRCMGTRVVDRPGGRKVEMPPFHELRAALTAYGDALADRALPETITTNSGLTVAHPGKRNLALPAASSVPTLEQIEALTADGLAKARQLDGAPGVVLPHLLQAPQRAKGMTGDGDLGEYEDTELADMEDAAKKE